MSDLVGLIAAIFLIVPPIKDQAYRYHEARSAAKPGHKWTQFADAVRESWKIKRDSYDFGDSLFLFLGALCLLFSYILKLSGH